MAEADAAEEAVRAAARATVRLLDGATARLAGVVPAREVVPALGPRRYLHAGPPLVLEEVPGPMRGALLGALVYEGEAATLAEAAAVLDAGDVALSSCNEAGGVGAMAGIVTPTMPVVVVEGDAGGVAFSPINEGLGQALRFGATGDDVLARLRWLRDRLAPLLDRAIRRSPAIELTEVQAEGLRRGDECHNRNVASSAALLLRLAPPMIRSAATPGEAADALAWAAGNRHFFLPFSMACGKALATRAHGVPASPVVTCMAANGRRFGIRVSGCGDEWFLAEAPRGRPQLFDGFTLDDVQPTMGDSFITETVGLGAFALSAAPAISSFLGTAASEAGALVTDMRRVTAGVSSRFVIPAEDHAGTPLGIDVTRVSETGITVAVNNGMAHRRPGVGQVGAGLTRLPLAPFEAAAARLRGQAPDRDSAARRPAAGRTGGAA